ncbi:hypothetical protein ABK040_015581 [Willaertia magna]
MRKKQYLYLKGQCSEFDEEKINNFSQKIKEISCGSEHLVLLDENNNVYVCGSNREGTGLYFTSIVTLENEIYISDIMSEERNKTFKKISNDGNIKKLKCGNNFIIVMNEKNELFGYGKNKSFTKLDIPQYLRVKDFCCNIFSSYVLMENGCVYRIDYNSSKLDKLDISFHCEQLALTMKNCFVLTTKTNELFEIGDLNKNLNYFSSKITKIYSSIASTDLYLSTKSNSIIKLNYGSPGFKNFGNEWKYNYFKVSSGNRFVVILNFNVEKEEMEEQLFSQTTFYNPFCDLEINFKGY